MEEGIVFVVPDMLNMKYFLGTVVGSLARRSSGAGLTLPPATAKFYLFITNDASCSLLKKRLMYLPLSVVPVVGCCRGQVPLRCGRLLLVLEFQQVYL